MKVYLIRHGDAVSSDVDPQRPLSDSGRAAVSALASFMKPLRISVEHIRHSGKLRAAQTAEILAEAVKAEKGCSAHEGLAPNDDASALADELGAYNTDLMIAGHLPFLSNLTSLLVTGRQTAGVVEFAAGAVVCLNRRAPGVWQIAWMMTPSLLIGHAT